MNWQNEIYRGPTNKLFDMEVKCSKVVEAEISNPAFLTDEDY